VFGEQFYPTPSHIIHKMLSKISKDAYQFFDIKFWKKGTVHLKWRDLALWQQFNITASAGKKWIGENTQQDKSA